MDETVRSLFEGQHGVATDRQLRAAGVTKKKQEAMIRRGEWIRAAPWCVRIAGIANGWEQRAMIASLAPGALLSGSSAARLHRLDGFRSVDDIEIVIHHNTRRPSPVDFRVRQSRLISAKDRHVIDAIAVTILPVTLIHLSADGLNAAKALDGALRDGARPRWLGECFRRWKKKGVMGAAPMLRHLDERIGARLPRSWFQRLAKAVLAEHGIELVDEHPVHDGKGRLLAELDLAHVELKVGVECQSWEHHGSPDAQRRDLARRRALRRLGWEIVEVWWSDLGRMADVVADLCIVIEQRRLLTAARPSGVSQPARSGGL